MDARKEKELAISPPPVSNYGRTRSSGAFTVEGPGPPCSVMTLVLPPMRQESLVCSCYAQTKALFMETDPHAYGVTGCFEDEGLSVALTHGGQGNSNRHLGRPLQAMSEARPNVLRSVSLR